jgi:hypothetical protein
MSIFNVLGHWGTPEFSTIYMVRSPEMQEAEARGGRFDVVVGTVRDLIDFSPLYKVELLHQRCYLFEARMDDIRDHARDSTSDRSLPSVTPTAEYFEQLAHRTEHLCQDHRMLARQVDPSQCICALNLCPDIQHSVWHSYTRTIFPKFIFERLLASNTSTMTINACTRFVTRTNKSLRRNYVWTIIIVLLVIGLPYFYNSVYTHFDPGCSTSWQQFFTMSWLAFGTVWGVFIYPYFVAYVDIYLDERQTKKARSKWWGRFQQYSIILVQVIVFDFSAIGGFVVVGQMLHEYGTCTVLN